jgi:hypothetical protein
VTERRRRRGADCLSDLELDSWLAGDLDVAGAARIRMHSGGCPACRTRLAEIEAERAAFQAAPPPLRARGATPPARRRRRWLAGGGTLLAAAAALLIWWRAQPRGGDGGEPGVTRLKGGGGRVALYVRHGEILRRAASGERVEPGDALQLAISSAVPTHVAVLSLDGAGTASVYFPRGPRAEQVAAGDEVALSTSVELDDVLGREQLHILLCDRAVEVEPLRATLAGPAHALPALPGCAVETLALEKWRPR